MGSGQEKVEGGAKCIKCQMLHDAKSASIPRHNLF